MTYLMRVTWIDGNGVKSFSGKDGAEFKTLTFMGSDEHGLSMQVQAWNELADELIGALQVGHNIKVVPSGKVVQSFEREDGTKQYTMPKVNAKFINILGSTVRTVKAETTGATVSGEAEIDFES